jgi:hypothetical protein
VSASDFFHLLFANPVLPALFVLVLLLTVMPFAVWSHNRLRRKERGFDRVFILCLFQKDV